MPGNDEHMTTTARSELEIVIRLTKGGPIVATEPVLDSDLAEFETDTWWSQCLRRGDHDVDVEDLDFAITPVRSSSGDAVIGFRVAFDTTDGCCREQLFARTRLEHVARRGARRLLADRTLAGTKEWVWELSSAAARPKLVAPRRAMRRRAALHYRVQPLAPLTAVARQQGPAAYDGQTRVFVTDAALALAEQISRAGASRTPPVETGGVLVGCLCACPDSGDMFIVVDDVLEAQASEATTFSLSYSGRTWSRISAVMRARVAVPEFENHRILGSCHAHPFRPTTGGLCDSCPSQATCDLDTAFLSEDDLLWCRAAFGGQPWQVHFVFGLDPRGQGVSAFFGRERGRLAARGFDVIPADFQFANTDRPSTAATRGGRTRG